MLRVYEYPQLQLADNIIKNIHINYMNALLKEKLEPRAIAYSIYIPNVMMYKHQLGFVQNDQYKPFTDSNFINWNKTYYFVEAMVYGKNVYIIDVLINNVPYPQRMKLAGAKAIIHNGFDAQCNIFICDSKKYEDVKKYIRA